MVSRKYINYSLFWAQILLLCGSFSFIMISMPWAMDDWIFKMFMEKTGLLNTLKILFYNDNNRIGNDLSIVLLQFPRIFSATIEVIAFLIGYYFLLKLSRIKTGQWKKLACFNALFVFGIMWQEYMFTHSFAFNYILPIPMLCALIYIFLYNNKIALWIPMLLGFIIGLWHESYSLVFLSGCFTLYLHRTFKFDKREKLIILSLIIGSLWIFINRLIWTRHDEIFNFQAKNLLYLLAAWVYLLFVFTWLYAKSKARLKNYARDPFVLFTLGGWITLPFIIFYVRERATMPALLLSCCALTILITHLILNMKRSVILLFSILLLMITSIHLIAIDVEGYKVISKYKEICRIYSEAPKGTKYVFAPVSYSYQAPFITLERPVQRLLDPTNLSMECLGEYYENHLIIVPEELAFYLKGEGNKISNKGDIREWKGYIVSSNIEDTIYSSATVKYDYGIIDREVNVANTVFVGADGEEYVYIFPERNSLSRYGGAPIHFEFMP